MDAADDSDEALMHAWIGGSADSFDRLYHRHRLKLYGYLLRQLRDQALADDLFQDVWQRVVAARGRWSAADGGFASWLYTIAHHRLGDHWRSARHRPRAPEDSEERIARLASMDTPENMASDFEQQRHLQLALEALPDEQRDVLLLRLGQELSLEDIGRITGVGRETVKSRLRYAMDKLRATCVP